ncbi:MAG: GxxExxY protein, partial [Planctomycetes bacterium]|nr:GxxExxY protein [Planctomycetota bacterium]
MKLEHEKLTGRIIGAAIEVHKALGPGYIESVYENALAVELRGQSISFVRQVSVPVLYRGLE